MKFDSTKFMAKPKTQLGWVAGGLAIAFIVLFLLAMADMLILPGAVNLIIGLGAGVLGFYALVKQGEGSWLIWLAIVTGLFAVLISAAAMLQ